MTDIMRIYFHALPNVISVVFKTDILNLQHENPPSQKGSALLQTGFATSDILNDSERNSRNPANLSD